MGDELEKFRLGAAASALTEAGKKCATSFLVLCGFLAAASIVVFTESAEANIAIPGLDLKVDKTIAGMAFTVLCCLGYFRWITFHEYQRLLYEKVDQLTRSDGERRFHWYVYYPSMFFFLEQIAEDMPKPAYFVGGVAIFSLLIGGLGYPIWLVYEIGAQQEFSVGWWFAAIFCVLIQVASVAVWLCNGRSAARQRLIERLETYDSSSASSPSKADAG